MTAETPYAGVFVKKADPMVLKDLDEKGLLFDAPKFEHSYPHCWRCDTPLLYYARESWFIKMTAVKDDLIRNNETINWIPESVGKNRFGDWLENVQDWGLSRNRYWGTPLNIWQCEDCGEMMSIGSIEELKEKYIVVSGDAENWEQAKSLLMSGSHNRTTFDGLALSENSEALAALNAETAAPTLQQLSVGLLKYAEEHR